MVIGVVWFFLGIFYWSIFLGGALLVHLHPHRKERRPLRAQGVYWAVLGLLVLSSWLNPLTATFFGVPVVFVAMLPFAVVRDLST